MDGSSDQFCSKPYQEYMYMCKRVQSLWVDATEDQLFFLLKCRNVPLKFTGAFKIPLAHVVFSCAKCCVCALKLELTGKIYQTLKSLASVAWRSSHSGRRKIKSGSASLRSSFVSPSRMTRTPRYAGYKIVTTLRIQILPSKHSQRRAISSFWFGERVIFLYSKH